MNHCLSRACTVLALFSAFLTVPSFVRGAETVSLRSTHKQGDVDQVAAQLEVGGTLKLVGEEGVKTLKMHATGKTAYHEKLLSAAPAPWDGLRLVREYGEAKAVIKVEEATTQRELRGERKTVGVAGRERSLELFGVGGPLTRDELDLLETPFNTAVLDELLPTKEVAVGDTWDHSAELAAALLGLDAAGVSDLCSTLTKLDDSTAAMTLAGNVEGAINGVSTKIEVKAHYRFDRKAGRVNFVGVLLKENRSIGHVGPGMEVTAKYQVKLTPGAANETLAAYQDATAFQDLASEYSLLEYQSPLDVYRVLYDNRWHVMTDEPNLLALRMVDRGELLAQAKISTPAGVQSDDVATIEAFQNEIQRSLAEDFGQFTSATTMQNSLGVVTHRVTVSGMVQELPIEWRYYMLISPAGKHVVVAFTLEADAATRFAQADERMVENLEFLDADANVATAPQGKQTK